MRRALHDAAWEGNTYKINHIISDATVEECHDAILASIRTDISSVKIINKLLTHMQSIEPNNDNIDWDSLLVCAAISGDIKFIDLLPLANNFDEARFAAIDEGHRSMGAYIKKTFNANNSKWGELCYRIRTSSNDVLGIRVNENENELYYMALSGNTEKIKFLTISALIEELYPDKISKYNVLLLALTKKKIQLAREIIKEFIDYNYVICRSAENDTLNILKDLNITLNDYRQAMYHLIIHGTSIDDIKRLVSYIPDKDIDWNHALSVAALNDAHHAIEWLMSNATNICEAQFTAVKYGYDTSVYNNNHYDPVWGEMCYSFRYRMDKKLRIHNMQIVEIVNMLYPDLFIGLNNAIYENNFTMMRFFSGRLTIDTNTEYIAYNRYDAIRSLVACDKLENKNIKFIDEPEDMGMKDTLWGANIIDLR